MKTEKTLRDTRAYGTTEYYIHEMKIVLGGLVYMSKCVFITVLYNRLRARWIRPKEQERSKKEWRISITRTGHFYNKPGIFSRMSTQHGLTWPSILSYEHDTYAGYELNEEVNSCNGFGASMRTLLRLQYLHSWRELQQWWWKIKRLLFITSLKWSRRGSYKWGSQQRDKQDNSSYLETCFIALLSNP